MKKASLLLSFLLAASASLMAQEPVILTFTANTQNGLYSPFDAVNVTNVTRGWTETLVYPDTILVLTPTVGLHEQSDALNLGKAYPNPFTEETCVSLEMPVACDALLQVVRIDGTVVSASQQHLQAGMHNVKVSLSSPSLAFLVVSTSQGRQVARMVCTGQGSRDGIEVETLSTGQKPSNQPVRSDATGEFQPGDMMRYTAVLFDGANTIYSNTITQQQYDSEIVTLFFDLMSPVGAINGLFSVSEMQQVYFSQGNLQYIGSTGSWRFAENQWDTIGSCQWNSSPSTDRDLFGWGTSGYNHGAVCYRPWSTSNNSSDYYAYGSYTYNLYDQSGQADWGYNAISNGGNQNNQWRTLKQEEWQYVFDTRDTNSGIRYAKAKVNNVNGVILLPDDWNVNYYSLSSTNIDNASFSSNVITASQWVILEQYGAVFLPAAGYRNGESVGDVGLRGHYWSSSYYSSYYAWQIGFTNSGLYTDAKFYRNEAKSVRLVQDYQR